MSIFWNYLSLHDLVLAFSTLERLGQQMINELDLKLTLGMAERRYTESPPDEEWSAVRIPVRPKVVLFQSLVQLLVQSVTAPVGHSSDVKQRKKRKSGFIPWNRGIYHVVLMALSRSQ